MNKLKYWVLCFILLFIMNSRAYSFEVDGFVTGKSQEEIRNKLTEWNFDRIEEKDNFIRAWDNPDGPTQRLLVFNFCNKKLMSIQKDLNPSMKNFILMFDKLSSKYGKPIDSKVDRTIDHIGETNAILFYWRSGKDLITLRYNVFPSNDQLSVSYDNLSKCSK